MFWKNLKFKKVKATGSNNDELELHGRMIIQGLEHYASFTEIKDAVIKEVVNQLKDDIALKVEAMKPEIASIITKQANKELENGN